MASTSHQDKPEGATCKRPSVPQPAPPPRQGSGGRQGSACSVDTCTLTSRQGLCTALISRVTAKIRRAVAVHRALARVASAGSIAAVSETPSISVVTARPCACLGRALACPRACTRRYAATEPHITSTQNTLSTLSAQNKHTKHTH